jgi:hypothetical protein
LRYRRKTSLLTSYSPSLGLVWAGGLSALNQFFYPRQPTITVAVYLAQLFGFAMGKAAATFLPSTIFFQGSRFAFTLNPGPWSMKEQTLITIMSNVSYSEYSSKDECVLFSNCH